jgi:hypothetical protein
MCGSPAVPTIMQKQSANQFSIPPGAMSTQSFLMPS